MKRHQYVPATSATAGSSRAERGERNDAPGGGGGKGQRAGGGGRGRGRGGTRGGGRGGRGGGRGGGPAREGWRLELAAIAADPDKAEQDGVVFLREFVRVEVVKGKGSENSKPDAKRTKTDNNNEGGRDPMQQVPEDAASEEDKARDRIKTRREEVLVIYDKMPKARRHMLVLPTSEVDGPESLKRFHLPVLRALHATALKTVAMLQAEDPSLTFQIGYHALPSLKQLHLHVVSQDFDSRCMNRELRWNSFTTPFFVPSTEMMAIIERDGKFDGTEYKHYLKQDIVCFRCHDRPRSFNDLKDHIATCLTPQHLSRSSNAHRHH